MTLAERARAAVRDRPFLLTALRAGACNHAAAARFLDVDGDEEAIATALRRYADELPPYEETDTGARVRMESGLGAVDDPDEAVLRVGSQGYAPDAGSLTGIVAAGDVGARALGWTLDRLVAGSVPVDAAGVAGDALVVVVKRRHAADAVRGVERALAEVPTSPDTSGR